MPRGVDHQEEIFRTQPVDKEVVDDSTPLVGQEGVVAFTIRELSRIVGEDGFQAGENTRSLRPDLPHVGNVKKAGGLASGVVFLKQAGELNGQIPAGKGNDPGPGGLMTGGQGGFRDRLRHEGET